MKINISFITSNDFRRLCPLVFVLNANKYQCFLILVKSFTACTFSRIYPLTVSNTNFHQFGHKFLAFKCPRQEAKTKQQQNKTTFTTTRSQECSPTNLRQPTKLFLARSQRDFALIGSSALPIVFSGIWLAQISCPIFRKLDSLLICKGKPYLKLSKSILNWTVREN